MRRRDAGPLARDGAAAARDGVQAARGGGSGARDDDAVACGAAATARCAGQAAIDELRAALAADDAHAARRGEARRPRGAGADGERPVPLDEQVGAMSGDATAGRPRRPTVERRRNPPGSQVAADPFIPLALADFHDLRRLGLFGDDGRNPPPSWWSR